MKKWFQFFFLSFFSHKTSKEATKRGYTNLFLGLLLTFAFLWMGVFGGDMLPFGVHYNNSDNFVTTVHTVLANPDMEHRVEIEIQEGVLKAKKQGSDFTQTLVVNTLGNESDRQVYAGNGYDVVVDTRPADTLAEIDAYCISNDGQELVISYEEYLSLSSVAKMSFDFKLRYTGNALVLSDELLETYKQYIIGLGEEKKAEAEKLENDLAEGSITKNEYDKQVYQLYFTNYYPDITEYESASKVPLLRNYYYHQYIKEGKNKYLLIFDDYLTGSFETDGGIYHSFYGFYNDMANDTVVSEEMEQAVATQAADQFIKTAFRSMAPITAYAGAMNTFTFIPLIALMPLVVALLAYSILRLRSVDSVRSFGGVVKIIGSYVWFSGLISAILAIVMSFFVQPSVIVTLPMVLFFVALVVRSIIFTVNEAKAFMKQSKQTSSQTEV